MKGCCISPDLLSRSARALMSTTAVRVLVYGNIEEEDAESLNKLILEGIEETAILTDNQVRFGVSSRDG